MRNSGVKSVNVSYQATRFYCPKQECRMHWFFLLAPSLPPHEPWEQEWQPLFLMPSCTSGVWGLILKTILLWSQIMPSSQGCLDSVATLIMKMEEEEVCCSLHPVKELSSGSPCPSLCIAFLQNMVMDQQEQGSLY